MSTPGPVEGYKPNPDYGRGVYRRRILLEAGEGVVSAALEDTNHAFRVAVRHDGERVTAIEPEVLRVPFTTCPGAVERLQPLIGAGIREGSRELNMQAGFTSNCTHLLDLTILAIRFAPQGVARRQWDVSVTDDDAGGEACIAVECDGRQLDQWRAKFFSITHPPELEGRPLYMGFARWATEHFPLEAQEAAFIMQKGYFVAQARRFDLAAAAGESAAHSGTSMQGACYTYTPGVMEHGVRTANSSRDFSDSAEMLLKFV